MNGTLSLRARLLLGTALWTLGLFGLASVFITQVMLRHPRVPVFFHALFAHAAIASLISIAFLLAGLSQVRRGMASINQLRTRLGGLRDGRDRRLEGVYPAEVQPLVGDLNQLLDQRETMISRARATAGDLAHGLKTPLAVLAQEAERAAAAGHLEFAATIRQQVDRMHRQVDYHLAQARVRASGPSRAGATTSVLQSAQGLARTLRRLHAERGVAIDVTVPDDVHVRVDREDLDEMLGNLLDNACKWARGLARLSADRDGASITVTVEDDGPGIAAALRAAVLERGVRADEAAPGSGLGLSIVRDLAEGYGGGVALTDSIDATAPGLRVVLRLPAA